MQPTRAHLLSALLVVCGVFGAADAAQAQSSCTQTTINGSQNSLRVNAGENICATNAGSVTAVSGFPSIGIEVDGPASGSATLLLTNTSSGSIVADVGSVVGISLNSGAGLVATFVDDGTVLPVGTD